MKAKHNILIKQGDRLVPYDIEDSLVIAKLEEGDRVVFMTDDTREVWRHRKYFKLLSEVINHMPEQLSEKYPKPENMLEEIKIQLGYVKKHYSLGGKELLVTKSISFATMGEKKFTKFVDDSRNLILKYFLVGVSETDFDRHFMSLIFN